MKPFAVSILILSIVVVSTVQTPLSQSDENPENLSGGYSLESSFKVDDNTSLRGKDCFNLLDRSTFTVTLLTVTSTTILTTTTTCSTSTTSLKACTVSGRRRRDVEVLGFSDNENEETREHDKIILSPSPTENEEHSGRSHQNDVGAEIEFVIEPSFLNDRSGQILRVLYYGTRTVTLTSISTSTRSLTAICSSTTGFQICGSSGK